MTFRKILVANRGEIACRIIRSIHKMGMKAVAVVSSADIDALHADMADEVVEIGLPPALESYLVVEKIVEAAVKTKSDAVHPGYGFLSENQIFPQALKKKGIAFIGPPQQAIAVMGDKLRSRKVAGKAGLPIPPGSESAVLTVKKALKIAQKIGYPIMLKAAAGGGGKGMRVVREDKELGQAFESATREAQSSFADARVFVERFIENPRHIEIQVLADQHGHGIYLGERECSIQRRNQKIIEEQPSPFVTPEMRAEMGVASLSLIQQVNYYSAGTVEFIVDQQKKFYFLEMNTRLQVEHPVTEMTNDIDLVEWMIRIAMGEHLSLRQEDISHKGWAVEARIYSEDPFRDCLPSIGYISSYHPPMTGKMSSDATIRHDTGVEEGSRVSMFYDPMLAKLIAHGNSRKKAIDALSHALDVYVIKGVEHNIPMLSVLLDHPDFHSGDLSTNFINKHYPDGFQNLAKIFPQHKVMQMMAQVAATLFLRQQRRLSSDFDQADKSDVNVSTPQEDWNMSVTLQEDDVVVIAHKGEKQSHHCKIIFDEDVGIIHIMSLEDVSMDIQCFASDDEGYVLSYRGFIETFIPMTMASANAMQYMKNDSEAQGKKTIVSPMPGLIVALSVQAGRTVKVGEHLLVIEAMKMENVISASHEALVEEVFVV